MLTGTFLCAITCRVPSPSKCDLHSQHNLDCYKVGREILALSFHASAFKRIQTLVLWIVTDTAPNYATAPRKCLKLTHAHRVPEAINIRRTKIQDMK